MDKKKIAFIVITAISVAASLVACALGIRTLPWTSATTMYSPTPRKPTRKNVRMRRQPPHMR